MGQKQNDDSLDLESSHLGKKSSINQHPNMLMVEDDSFGEKLAEGVDDDELITPASQLGA